MRFLISMTLIFLISGCKNSKIPESVQQGIDSIAHKWVPDTREGICSVSLTVKSGKTIVIKGETNFPEAKDEVINFISNSGMLFLDSIKVLPDTLEIKKIWGLVTISVCNLKKTPSHSSELVSQAIMGTPVKILKIKGGWLLIQTPDYYIGWVNNSGIQELSSKEFEKWKRADRLIFTGKAGDILSDSKAGNTVSDIVAGSIVERVGEKNESYEIQLPDGRKGVINKAFVIDFKSVLSEGSRDAGKMVAFAKSLTGSPYLWGGTSSKAIDCSGFTKIIYFSDGVILSRDASLQFIRGIPVDVSHSLDSLSTGDLIFFGSVRNGEKRITHVGMYIGNTEVIHSSGMVRINSLDSLRTNYSRYLKETMMGARRIIGTISDKGTERLAVHSWYN